MSKPSALIRPSVGSYSRVSSLTRVVLPAPFTPTTAVLDVRAEVAFFDRFVELTRGVTSLLISHRFSSVRRADRIVVIDGGRVVEQGSHDELMTRDGHYARLFRLQAERFAAGLDAEGNDQDHEDDEDDEPTGEDPR